MRLNLQSLHITIGMSGSPIISRIQSEYLEVNALAFGIDFEWIKLGLIGIAREALGVAVNTMISSNKSSNAPKSALFP